jgi:hypothetical protein
MKKFVPLTLQANRIRVGQYASDEAYGLAGAFRLIPPLPDSTLLLAMSSGGGPACEGWEHVSVSAEHRTPRWDEMCWIKDLFWDKHELVVQYHPPESEYVNFHPYCLHLWAPTEMTIPLPPMMFVGPKTR